MALAVLVLTTFDSNAYVVNLEKLRTNWNSKNETQVAFVLGYIFSSYDSIAQSDDICIAEGAKWPSIIDAVLLDSEQAEKSVSNMFNTKPEFSEVSAQMFIVASLKKLYPCANKK